MQKNKQETSDYICKVVIILISLSGLWEGLMLVVSVGIEHSSNPHATEGVRDALHL